MFETEADYIKAKKESKERITEVISAWSAREETIHDEGFQKGVVFGYNKAKEEMQKNGLALQSDMDKTIEQNIALKEQIEKMKCCSNCNHYGSTFGLCDYSMGDEDYDCCGRKWEINEK